MRILLCHKFFHLVGGAEVFFFETGKALESHGHSVAYFSTRDEKNIDTEYHSHFVDPPVYKNGNIFNRVWGIGKMIYSFEAKEKFEKLVITFKPDLVHVFAINIHISFSILDVCKKYNLPVIMSCNDYKHICPNYKLYHHGKLCTDCRNGNYLNAIKNVCCKDSMIFSVASAVEAYSNRILGFYKNKVNLFLFASEFMRDKTREFWGNIGLKFKDGILRNPFNAPDYVYSDLDDGFALYFGRLEEDKGVFDILQVAKNTPEIEFKIIGSGGGMNKALDFVQTNGLKNVEMIGELWGEERDEFIKRSGFVLVSSRWHENFPYVINQSFAFGKPVVGANRGGIPELVCDQKRGLLYNVDLSGDFEKKIRQLWIDKTLRKKLGQEAKRWVDQEFNDEKFYQAIKEHYKRLFS